MTKCIQIHPDDNVAVALHPVAKGEEIELGGVRVTAAEDIPQASRQGRPQIRQQAAIQNNFFSRAFTPHASIAMASV